MKKIFLEYKKDISNYWNMIENSKDPVDGDIYFLYLSLNPYHDWISTIYKDDKVYIWNDFDEEDYDSWDDIPKVELSKKNYEHIVKEWNQNVKNPAPYLVFSQDDAGWFDLQVKQKLSNDELNEIKKDQLSN